MKIFYNAQFLEDGRTIDLISIGMVAEDGRELYLVNQAIEDDESFYTRICQHDWLMKNVIPSLPLREDRGVPQIATALQAPFGTNRGMFHLDRDNNRIVPMRFIRNAVREFIWATPEPQLWAWYADYGHVAYAQLFGRMVSLPDGLPMFTLDLKQEAVRLGDPQVPQQQGGPFTAFEAARHNRVIDQFLAEHAAKIGA